MTGRRSFVDGLAELDLAQTRARVAKAMTALKQASADKPAEDGDFLRSALREAEGELLSGARRALWKIDAALASHHLGQKPAPTPPAAESRGPSRLPKLPPRPQVPPRRPA